MYAWIFKKVGWKFLAAGAAAAVVGAPFVRPAAVGLAKLGLNAKDSALDTLAAAKTHTSSILAEASALRQSPVVETATTDIADELRKLREEVAALRAQQATA